MIRPLDVTQLSPHESIVQLEGVTVSFDGFKALDDLAFFIEVGELRVVIGPNGAGKTTLIDVISGKVKPTVGRVVFGHDVDLVGLRDHEISNLGIGRKFQTPTVFEKHTVRENLELSLKGNRGVWATLFLKPSAADRGKIDSTLERVGLKDRAEDKAGLLSHGQKQWLEIGMLMMQDPKLLLLDEPVAGMSDEETEKTGDLILSIAKDRSVMVVEHDMEFVRRLKSKVTVLHEGKILCEGSMEKVQNDARVIEVYLGRDSAKGHA
ncbi:MAG TPA: urea ABC transporter ATP-binding protein UrtD [Planctomycetota bacterium]|nr:urea ABC transporter ATP-binding protein UrtD [Planctomycetota bacterium]